jgi:hypothetical protein
MTWWAWVLVGWSVLSVPVAVLVGRVIAMGRRPTGADEDLRGPLRGQGAGPPSLPPPRDGDEGDGRQAPAV